MSDETNASQNPAQPPSRPTSPSDKQETNAEPVRVEVASEPAQPPQESAAPPVGAASEPSQPSQGNVPPPAEGSPEAVEAQPVNAAAPPQEVPEVVEGQPEISSQTTMSHSGEGDVVGGDHARGSIDKSSHTQIDKGVHYHIYGTNIPSDMFQGRTPEDLDSFLHAKRLLSDGRTWWGGYAPALAPQPTRNPFQINVGSLRGADRDTGPVLRRLDGKWLHDTVMRFVAFDECHDLQKKLRQQHFLVLTGTDELLVHQVALWLIHEGLSASMELEQFPAYSINMRTGLKDFVEAYPHEDELRGAWYFAQNVPESTFSGISAQNVGKIRHDLEVNDSYLILTVKLETPISRVAMGASLHQIETSPAVTEVIAAYVRTDALPEDDKNTIIRQLTESASNEQWRLLLDQHSGLNEMYILAERVIATWNREDRDPEANIIAKLFDEHQPMQVYNWFNKHQDWPTRAYMLALAVLDGALPDEIHHAYINLLELWELEEPATRPRLAEMLGKQRTIIERTERGYRRIRVNGLQTSGLYGLVLYHIWDEMYRENDTHRLNTLIAWLKMLVTIPDSERTRNLAARAIGTLADEYFRYIEDYLIADLIRDGIVGFSTQELPKSLHNIMVMIDYDSERLQDNEELQNFLQEQFIWDIHQLAMGIEGLFEESRLQAMRSFDVIGNILGYGIETGNDDFRQEVLELVANLTHVDEASNWIGVDAQDIVRDFIDFLGNIETPTAVTVRDLITDPDVPWAAFIQYILHESIHTSLLVYQQTVGLAVHFYAGGNVVDRVCQDLRRLTDEKNEQQVSQIDWAVRTTIHGTIRKRLNLPGDPRPDIENLLQIVNGWIKGGRKRELVDEYGNTLQHQLLRIGLDIYSDLATEITEPFTQVENAREDSDRPLLQLNHTDWPLLLFLSLYSEAQPGNGSDPIQDFVTHSLRYLISNRKPLPGSALYWKGYMKHFLDTSRRRGMMEPDEDQPWTMRDQGYSMLEYWMLFAVGREDGQKPVIKRVDDVDEYKKHLWRIIAGCLQWYPSRNTRARILQRMDKLARRRQTVAPIAQELYDNIYNYTHEDGTPIS